MVSIILAASQVTRSAEKKAEAADQARQVAENRERLLNRMLEEAEQAKADAEARAADEAKSRAAAQAPAAAEAVAISHRYTSFRVFQFSISLGPLTLTVCV